MSGDTLVVQLGRLINKLGMILCNPAPKPSASPKQGTSPLVEVPSPLVGPLGSCGNTDGWRRHWFARALAELHAQACSSVRFLLLSWVDRTQRTGALNKT